MAGITMCKGADCPDRNKCYRFVAAPSTYAQSYFLEHPRDNGACPQFWPTSRLPQVNRADQKLSEKGAPDG